MRGRVLLPSVKCGRLTWPPAALLAQPPHASDEGRGDCCREPPTTFTACGYRHSKLSTTMTTVSVTTVATSTPTAVLNFKVQL